MPRSEVGTDNTPHFAPPEPDRVVSVVPPESTEKAVVPTAHAEPELKNAPVTSEPAKSVTPEVPQDAVSHQAGREQTTKGPQESRRDTKILPAQVDVPRPELIAPKPAPANLPEVKPVLPSVSPESIPAFSSPIRGGFAESAKEPKKPECKCGRCKAAFDSQVKGPSERPPIVADAAITAHDLVI